MRRRLSSIETFLVKLIFPAVWILASGYVILFSFFGQAADRNAPPVWVVLTGWLLGSAFVYWEGIRLKYVSVDEDFLYASNYFKEIFEPVFGDTPCNRKQMVKYSSNHYPFKITYGFR